MEENVNTEENKAEEIKDPQGLLAAYNKAKEDLVALRTENKTLKASVEEAANAPKVDVDEVTAEWKKRAINAETRLALNSQGIKDADRLMKYVGTDGLDFDENGSLTGLDERLAELKTDLPEIFDAKRRVGGNADIFANDSVETVNDPFREQIRRAVSN